ncbi:ParA family protein [Leptolyngbya sp. FACHB-261]|uniref:ParA family protein n=1 Tax=Leptolyngbya sp. FACHB-261 TaxID=2692806 RepID=UPI001687D91E|nr:ParA family protein [Leptolyngbya sp. FACHB-261]MBD2103756.1 ParA family protein [Leptolyngbya sp. FACHB-261]
MAKVIAFTNNKGGTGKSTICCSTAHLVACRGVRVLVIDMTSQTTASSLFLGNLEALDENDTVLTFLKKRPERNIEDVIFESQKGLDIVPSHVSMAEAVTQLASIQMGKEMVLKKQIERVSEHYDYIFIDSPGDLNELTANALVPADKVLLPTRLNRTDFQCTETTIRFIQEAESYIGPRKFRVVVNMLDDRYLPGGIWAASHTGQLYQHAREMFGDILCPVTVPDSADIRTAFDRGLTILEHKPESEATRRLEELVQLEVFGV